MSKLLEKSEEKKTKIDSLISGFSKAGFDVESKINQDELKKYLDSHSSSGKFEQVLSYKLIQVLSLDKEDSISIEDFISGFLQFKENIKNNSEDLKKKLIEENEIYKKLLEEKPENSEKNEDAKVFGEITDIDIRRKLKGIKEIIIKIASPV
jgi:superfamily I DNA/RNA helicase